jgi:hypothetical protein
MGRGFENAIGRENTMRSKHAFAAILPLALAILAATIIGSSAMAQVLMRAETSELGKLPPGGLAINDGRISADGSRWAAVILGLRDAKKPALPENLMAAVVADGKADPWCSRVANLSFSRDGRHLLYRAFVDAAGGVSTSSLILDGQPVGAYDAILSEPAFDAEGRLAPFLARKGNRYLAVIDGKIAQEYPDAVSGLTLSPDGRRSMYCLTRIVRSSGTPALKSSVVVDGKEDVGRYDKVLYTWFSPDSKRTLWAAMDDEKFVVAVDGKVERSGAEKLTPARFSRDGAHVGYGIGVRTSSRLWDCSIIVDGKLVSKHEIIGNMQFSPDGRAWWSGNYWEKSADGSDEVMFGVFCDARKVYSSADYQVVNIDFSADGKHVVYEALPKNPDKAHPDSRAYILDGTPGPVYEKVLSPLFSADGAHLAYGAAKDGKWFVVSDGRPQPKFEAVSQIAFSPDGRHLIYQAKIQGRPVWIINGKAFTDYPQISPPQFMPGGAIEFLAHKAGALARVKLVD